MRKRVWLARLGPDGGRYGEVPLYSEGAGKQDLPGRCQNQCIWPHYSGRVSESSKVTCIFIHGCGYNADLQKNTQVIEKYCVLVAVGS